MLSNSHPSRTANKDTSSNEEGGGQSCNFEPLMKRYTEWFGKLFLIWDAYTCNSVETVYILSDIFAGKFTHYILKDQIMRKYTITYIYAIQCKKILKMTLNLQNFK